MTHQSCVGMVVGEHQIYGVIGHQEEGQVIVEDAFSLSRQGNYRDDCARFIGCYSLENEMIGVVVEAEYKMHHEKIIPMTKEEVGDILTWKIKEYIDWPEDFYFYDFVVKDSNLFVVAAPKELIQSVADGVLKSKGRLRIIDYWPASLLYTYEGETFITALYKEKQWHLYGWHKGMCITQLVTNGEAKDLALGMEQVLAELETEGFLPLDGVELFTAPDNDLDYEAIVDHFGAPSLAAFHFIKDVEQSISLQDIGWRSALGLLRRLLLEMSR